MFHCGIENESDRRRAMECQEETHTTCTNNSEHLLFHRQQQQQNLQSTGGQTITITKWHIPRASEQSFNTRRRRSSK